MSILYIVYALLLLLGGALGYARAKSLPSLLASAAAAVLSVTAALLFPHSPTSALGLESVVAAILIVVFIRRYQATKKPMPAMPILALSAVVLIASLVTLAGRH